MNRYEMEPILNPAGRFVIYGDAMNTIRKLEARIAELEGVNDMLNQRNARYLAALTEIGEQDENALVYLPTAYLKGNHARKAIH